MIALNERLKKLEAAQADSNAKLNALAKSLEQPPTPENSYKLAFDAFKAGETVKSRDMFNKFTELHPGSQLAANARYWVGETYYQEKNFEQAALEFQRVITEYPGKEKVPAAMLKQGLAFKELGDTKSARFIIRELIEKFPKAEEIPAAKEVLQKLK
jgi:tol-pal system protein YbgF